MLGAEKVGETDGENLFGVEWRYGTEDDENSRERKRVERKVRDGLEAKGRWERI